MSSKNVLVLLNEYILKNKISINFIYYFDNSKLLHGCQAKTDSKQSAIYYKHSKKAAKTEAAMDLYNQLFQNNIYTMSNVPLKDVFEGQEVHFTIECRSNHRITTKQFKIIGV